ncbi:MAG TPA: hypothetical protein VK043_04680 [Burkholderiales bacterium]|nr:hypothetical protein [Burkholderiales bacterium]
MLPDFPIEQLLRRRDTRFQLGFANQAKHEVPPGEGFELRPTRMGLQVLGRNEESLAPPVRVLRETYGEALEVGPPRVRIIEGVRAQEPVMDVKISLDPRHVALVKRALEKRDALLVEESAGSPDVVLRYEAPLVALLGLADELATLTDGTSRHTSVLSYYRLVTGGPGGSAA